MQLSTIAKVENCLGVFFNFNNNILFIYQCDESNMLVLHWFVGNDEDNVMGVVSHDHLANY